jgi:osmoprotectant transport system ATP-binding protein
LRLALDVHGRPRGWAGPGGDLLPAEGSWTAGDSLRTITDLAILSPAGAAVRVDAEGRADGLVRHSAVIDHVRARQLARLSAAGLTTAGRFGG